MYKPYYTWRIFYNLGVSLDGWFKMPSARSMKIYRAEYDRVFKLIEEQNRMQ